jgi:hypothetical protein
MNPFGTPPSDIAYIEKIRTRVRSRRWLRSGYLALLVVFSLGCVWLTLDFNKLLDGMGFSPSAINMGLVLGFSFGAGIGVFLCHTLSGLLESSGWIAPARTEELLLRYYDQCSHVDGKSDKCLQHTWPVKK